MVKMPLARWLARMAEIVLGRLGLLERPHEQDRPQEQAARRQQAGPREWAARREQAGPRGWTTQWEQAGPREWAPQRVAHVGARLGSWLWWHGP